VHGGHLEDVELALEGFLLVLEDLAPALEVVAPVEPGDLATHELRLLHVGTAQVLDHLDVGDLLQQRSPLRQRERGHVVAGIGLGHRVELAQAHVHHLRDPAPVELRLQINLEVRSALRGVEQVHEPDRHPVDEVLVLRRERVIGGIRPADLHVGLVEIMTTVDVVFPRDGVVAGHGGLAGVELNLVGAGGDIVRGAREHHALRLVIHHRHHDLVVGIGGDALRVDDQPQQFGVELRDVGTLDPGGRHQNS
jgi:hypothetical protein